MNNALPGSADCPVTQRRKFVTRACYQHEGTRPQTEAQRTVPPDSARHQLGFRRNCTGSGAAARENRAWSTTHRATVHRESMQHTTRHPQADGCHRYRGSFEGEDEHQRGRTPSGRSTATNGSSTHSTTKLSEAPVMFWAQLHWLGHSRENTEHGSTTR
jgi:hypothetical protein